MLDTATDPATLIAQMGNRARRAATQIARIPANRKCAAKGIGGASNWP